MSFGQELSDFATQFEKTDKQLSGAKGKKRKAADATADVPAPVEPSKDLFPPAERTDLTNKGFGSYDSGA
jgi:hypothetical protein